MNVSDAMAKQIVCCLKSDTAQSVATLMKRHDIGSVPVVADLISKRVEGIVIDRDICLRLITENKDPVTTHIAALMTPNPVTCAPNDPLQRCENLMHEHKVRRIPVVDKQGRCVRVVAQPNIALHDRSDGVAICWPATQLHELRASPDQAQWHESSATRHVDSIV
jgi:CBS domain-containing protein